MKRNAVMIFVTAVAVQLALLVLPIAGQITCDHIFPGDFTTLPPAQPSVCSQLIDYPIAIPEGSCQSFIESTKLGTLASVSAVLTETCRIAVAKATCISTFPRCNAGATATDPPTASLPCRSVCAAVSASCAHPLDAGILAQLSEPLDCDDSSVWDQDETSCWAGPTVTDAQVLRPACETYTGSVCANDVPGSVYIPAGLSQPILEAVAQSQQFLFAVSPRSTGCDVMMQAFVCAQTFMQCDPQELIPGTGVTLPLPRLPCGDLCDEFSARCAPLFDAVPELSPLLPNCSAETFGEIKTCDGATVIMPGQADYPPATSPYTAFTPDGSVVSECSLWASAATPTVVASAVTAVNFHCPAPLVHPENPNWPTILDGACADPCPMFISTHEEYERRDLIFVIISSVSFALVTFVLVTMLVFAQHRTKRYLIYLAASATLLSFILVLGYALRGDKLTPHSLCKTNVEEYHMEGFCLGQAMILVYAISACCAWWLVQAFDVFSKVVLGENVVKGSDYAFRRELLLLIFGWGVPLIPVIAALGTENFSALSIGQPWCIFGGHKLDPNPIRGFHYFMVIPMFIFCCIGVLMMGATTVKLVLSAHRARRTGTANANPWGPYLRVLIFIAIMTFEWAYMFAYDVIANRKHSDWNASGVEFVTCLLFTQFVVPGTYCNDVPNDRMRPSMIDSLVVITSLPGTLIFLFLGTNFAFYRAWAGLFYRKFGIRCFAKYAAEGHSSTRGTRDLSHSGIISDNAHSHGITSGGGAVTSASSGAAVPAGGAVSSSQSLPQSSSLSETEGGGRQTHLRSSVNGGGAAAGAGAAGSHGTAMFAKSNRYRNNRAAHSTMGSHTTHVDSPTATSEQTAASSLAALGGGSSVSGSETPRGEPGTVELLPMSSSQQEPFDAAPGVEEDAVGVYVGAEVPASSSAPAPAPASEPAPAPAPELEVEADAEAETEAAAPGVAPTEEVPDTPAPPAAYAPPTATMTEAGETDVVEIPPEVPEDLGSPAPGEEGDNNDDAMSP